jgi:hypothetical protein
MAQMSMPEAITPSARDVLPLMEICGLPLGVAGMLKRKSMLASAHVWPASSNSTLASMTLFSFLPKVRAIWSRAICRSKL